MINISVWGQLVGFGFGEQGNQVIVLAGNEFCGVFGSVGKCC